METRESKKRRCPNGHRTNVWALVREWPAKKRIQLCKSGMNDRASIMYRHHHLYVPSLGCHEKVKNKTGLTWVIRDLKPSSDKLFHTMRALFLTLSATLIIEHTRQCWAVTPFPSIPINVRPKTTANTDNDLTHITRNTTWNTNVI